LNSSSLAIAAARRAEEDDVLVACQEAELVVDIASGEVTGDFPHRPLRLLLEWVDLHRVELEVNWTRAREHRHLLPVEPLT